MPYEIYLMLTEENNLLGEMRESDSNILLSKTNLSILSL